MPEPNDGEKEDEYISRCIKDVVDAGETDDNKQAYAICKAKWDKKSITMTSVIDAESFKIGARHSAKDNEALQSIHDGAVTLGAICATKPEVTSEPISKNIDDDILITYGSAIKVLDTVDGKTKVGGYLITFTDAEHPDKSKHRDYFDKDTDFAITFPAKSLSWCNHRMPIKTIKGLRMLDGNLEPVELTKDEIGIFATGLLDERNEYEKMLLDMANHKKLGFSSGTAGHLTKCTLQDNGTNHIDLWPLGLDASYTHMPAEPQNMVISLKSLSAYTSDEPKPNSEPEAVSTAVQEVEATAQTTNSNQEEIKMTEQVQVQDNKTLIESAVAEAMKAFIAAQPAVNGAGVSVVTDEGDQPFETPGAFFKAVKNAGVPNSYFDPRLASIKAPTGLNEGVPSQGGFLVPPSVASGIITKMNSVGTLLSLFPPTPVEGNSMTWNVVDETSRANGSRMGGITGYWLNEAGTKTSSKPKFRQLELKLKKIAALCYATDELLEDASALGSWLVNEVPNELRFMVEDSIINGDGVGKPEGILGGAALKSAVRTDASEIDPLDLGRMWAARYAGANDYVWLVNPSTFPQLVNMSIGNQPVYVGAGGVHGLPTATIFGRPVYETEYNPALGTLGDILLISPSQYKMIEKAGGIQSASSIHVNFIYDETAFRFVYRVDGAPLWYTTLTGKDTSTYSPYVALAATT